MTDTRKAKRRGRDLRTAEERQELIERYKASGQGKAEFCAQHGLKLMTLYGWLNPRRSAALRRRAMKAPVKFARMEVALDRVPALPAVEIALPSGVRVRLREAAAVADLAKFVREVGAC